LRKELQNLRNLEAERERQKKEDELKDLHRLRVNEQELVAQVK
jgi:hypothetical protein